jgi:hypothetical protein
MFKWIVIVVLGLLGWYFFAPSAQSPQNVQTRPPVYAKKMTPQERQECERSFGRVGTQVLPNGALFEGCEFTTAEGILPGYPTTPPPRTIN